jgi:hypothetical protein
VDEPAEQMLACGLRRDAREHRRALLERIDQRTRGALLDAGRELLPAERISAVLECGLASIGDIDPVTAEDTRDLTVGDRDLLILALHRLLYGPELDCVFSCACGERLELTVDLTEVLDRRKARVAAALDAGNRKPRAIRGREHERASRLALNDRAAARRELATACVGAPDADLAELDQLLSELDPYAEITLGASCPVCGESVTAILDPITHLWEELAREQQRLEHDIHVLALNYHWSEHEIITLSPQRRARYLAMLESEWATA